MAKTALLAKLTAKDGQRDALLSVISDLGLRNVSGEPGTEVYAAHKDQNDENGQNAPNGQNRINNNQIKYINLG